MRRISSDLSLHLTIEWFLCDKLPKFDLKMIKCCVLLLSIFMLCDVADSDQSMHHEAIRLVEQWSNKIGEELYKLSLQMTRKDRVTKSFRPLKDKIYDDDGDSLVQDVANDLNITMNKKVEAVKRIAEYAEFLANHRETEDLSRNNDYQFYNANNITNNTAGDPDTEERLQEEIQEAECEWWCQQKDLPPIPNNMITKENIIELFGSASIEDEPPQCDCLNPPNRRRPIEHFNSLPMREDPEYKTKVNFNLSVVKINANIYHRDKDVLEGVRWSEALDLMFKANHKKDPTLKFQYFASPLGFMRHYPAVRWSSDRYDMTYDPRTRSWYTEAMTSPKDIFILLDRSGSMEGEKRVLSAQIVNNILDTLNDNDFVNIYTFTNSTEPLVDCFQDTLVEANEENLRLLRESLDYYTITFAANISIGLIKAFEVLGHFRKKEQASQCNQAIMLITEGIDYEIHSQLFNYSNWAEGTPVRIFTYELKTNDRDSRIMEWIACSNRGYFVNVSLLQEVREKILPYINVMSRPINHHYTIKQKPIWSYLYIDLADRRYSNWLWRKFEGNRQREIFLDHAKRDFMRQQKFLTSETYMLLHEADEDEMYKRKQDFDYMTTVSLPVYGRRKDVDVDLIGVAGVDVPIKLLNSLIPHHKLGVNGYAFIVTNNGYILMHPKHRREFENIPKPTFNRVDLLEVEILDDKTEPRLFDKSVVNELREKIVKGLKNEKGGIVLKVKSAIDGMKRIMLNERRYYHTAFGPFRLAIALPDKYGFMIVNNTEVTYEFGRGLNNTQNWTVHPDWIYCKDDDNVSPKEVVLNCLRDKREAKPLFASLLFDANATIWFEGKIEKEDNFVKKYLVDNVFMATHSGLTRWKKFANKLNEDDEEDEEKNGTFEWTRAIDEDWYKRTVDENYNKDEDMFIYSVPFEISGFENNTKITSTSTIFVNTPDKNNKDKRTPVAVVGLQFNHRAMFELYKGITTKCSNNGRKPCNNTCDSPFWTCFILDNNAYVVLSDEPEYTGRYIGDIKPTIMYYLIQNKVYKRTRMFDYQAICQKLPQGETNSGSYVVSNFRKLFLNFLRVTEWALATIFFLIGSVIGGPQYQSNKNDTLAYEKLEIVKTLPTPCDQEMSLFTLGKNFNSTVYNGSTTKFNWDWPYVVKRIPKSNLLFMVINTVTDMDTTHVYHDSPTPKEIVYPDNMILPCYIAIKNKFTRKVYMNCYNATRDDRDLNNNATFCGHTWK